jgi:hypothetical protein
MAEVFVILAHNRYAHACVCKEAVQFVQFVQVCMRNSIKISPKEYCKSQF